MGAGASVSHGSPILSRRAVRRIEFSQFRVRGTKGLRVVDASVFPEIPGLFVVSAIYMVAEKASEVILDAAKAESAVRG